MKVLKGLTGAAAPPGYDLSDNVIAATFPQFAALNAQAATTGQVRLSRIRLTAGQTVAALRFIAATTAGSGLTHSIAGLYSASQAAPALLATSPDDTTATWAASTTRTFTMVTPYVVPATGWYYVGFAMVGTTLPTLFHNNPSLGVGMNTLSPSAALTGQSGLTTALPATVTTLTVIAGRLYAEAM